MTLTDLFNEVPKVVARHIKSFPIYMKNCTERNRLLVNLQLSLSIHLVSIALCLLTSLRVKLQRIQYLKLK